MVYFFRAYVKLSAGNLSFLRYIGWAHPPSTPPVESACFLGSLVASKKMFMPGISPRNEGSVGGDEPIKNWHRNQHFKYFEVSISRTNLKFSRKLFMSGGCHQPVMAKDLKIFWNKFLVSCSPFQFGMFFNEKTETDVEKTGPSKWPVWEKLQKIRWKKSSL